MHLTHFQRPNAVHAAFPAARLNALLLLVGFSLPIGQVALPAADAVLHLAHRAVVLLVRFHVNGSDHGAAT